MASALELETPKEGAAALEASALQGREGQGDGSVSRPTSWLKEKLLLGRRSPRRAFLQLALSVAAAAALAVLVHQCFRSGGLILGGGHRLRLLAAGGLSSSCKEGGVMGPAGGGDSRKPPKGGQGSKHLERDAQSAVENEDEEAEPVEGRHAPRPQPPERPPVTPTAPPFDPSIGFIFPEELPPRAPAPSAPEWNEQEQGLWPGYPEPSSSASRQGSKGPAGEGGARGGAAAGVGKGHVLRPEPMEKHNDTFTVTSLYSYGELGGSLSTSRSQPLSGQGLSQSRGRSSQGPQGHDSFLSEGSRAAPPKPSAASSKPSKPRPVGQASWRGNTELGVLGDLEGELEQVEDSTAFYFRGDSRSAASFGDPPRKARHRPIPGDSVGTYEPLGGDSTGYRFKVVEPLGKKGLDFGPFPPGSSVRNVGQGSKSLYLRLPGAPCVPLCASDSRRCR